MALDTNKKQPIINKPGGFIWGSNATNITDYPYIATIEVDGKHLCSAGIIDDYYVITSASCVENVDLDKSQVIVRVGTDKLGYKGQEYNVTDIQLNKLTDTDLAMVKVASAFTLSAKVVIANPTDDKIYGGMTGTVLGWADIKEKNSSMIAATGKTMDDYDCEDKYYDGHTYILTKYQYCITSTAKNHCEADLGAPFYMKEQLYGVVSFNPGCDSELPLVITGLGRSGSFIVQVLCNMQ